MEKRTERWKEILANPKDSSHTLVAVEDGQILGFCCVSHCRDEDMSSEVSELWSIYVDAKSIGKGIGTALMKKGIGYLKEQGYKKATLWVLINNEKTRKWYKSKGWRVEGKTKTEKVGEIDIQEIRYILDLEYKF